MCWSQSCWQQHLAASTALSAAALAGGPAAAAAAQAGDATVAAASPAPSALFQSPRHHPQGSLIVTPGKGLRLRKVKHQT